MTNSTAKLGASVPKTKVAGGFQTTTATCKTAAPDFALAITAKQEHRADTRLMALALGVKHKSLFELVRNYKNDFQVLGKVPFQTEALPSGQTERFALLSEDQAYLLLTYSRNTAKVRHLKVKLVQAFRDARRAAELRQSEYLPEYRQMRDAIHVAADGSPSERWMHVNANKALNQLVGIGAGQRATAGPLAQSLMAVGCALAAKAVREGEVGQGVQQRIKAALEPLAGVLALGEVQHGN
jgi:phage regulator Rha-like protein